MRPLCASCHLSLGRYHAQQSRVEPARLALSTAAAMFQAMTMPLGSAQAEAALHQLV